MAIKISELAEKLGIPTKELRAKIAEAGFTVAPRANLIKEDLANEILKKLQKEPIEEKFPESKEESRSSVPPSPIPSGIVLPKVLTVKELAEKIGVSVAKIITQMIKNGIVATINDLIDFDTAAIISYDLGIEVSQEPEPEEKTKPVKENLVLEQRIPRPPVVTVMGHVDHGKTTLLDFIRKTSVTSTESGGITQHIGAYQTEVKSKKWEGTRLITFLDTPGHEAFSAMRAHGARVTDIIVLVVAADDGVKPQTIEAIDHAKAAGIPPIVAINKIDKPEANPDRVKRELSELGLVPEEWGGRTIMVPVSAKTGQGIEDLLEMILLLADVQNLVADPTQLATGVIIESKLSRSKGPTATVLVQNGTLKLGDIVVIGGEIIGKIRLLQDYLGHRIKEAPPSTPVRIAGLENVPQFGSKLQVFENLARAKQYILETAKQKGVKKLTRKIGIAELSEAIKAGKIKELKIILKADVMGSLEAIESSISNLKTEEAAPKIIHKGVGNINESDVMMAQASEALVVGFKVGIAPAAKKIADSLGVKISIYEVVYEIFDDISAALSGLLEPEIIETITSKSRVLKIFKDSRADKILGVRVLEGKIKKGALARIKRNETLVAEGKVTSLRQGPEDILEAKKGLECGVGFLISGAPTEGKITVLPDDIFETYIQEEKIRKIH